MGRALPNNTNCVESILADEAPKTTNVVQFGNMIKAVTGRSSLDYLGYGCWCGPGGKGISVDGTDR